MATKPNFNQCCGQGMTDWSYYPRNISIGKKVPHFYCPICGCHIHRKKRYTKDEWFFYINGIAFEDYQRQLMEEQLEGCHAHEQINHSDPEVTSG
jgi:hypothetical protein